MREPRCSQKVVGTMEKFDKSALISLREKCGWPDLYYSMTESLLTLVGGQAVLEVGVAYGLHARHLLERFPKLSYFGVDPYLPGYDESDPFVSDVAKAYRSNPTLSLDQLFRDVSGDLQASFGSRARLFRQSLQECTTDIPASHFDMVFIDGSHKYEDVRIDLRLATEKLRPGGIVVGDDWAWPGVRRAFEEVRYPLTVVRDPKSGYELVFFVPSQRPPDKKA